jgi:hypothetical protein
MFERASVGTQSEIRLPKLSESTAEDLPFDDTPRPEEPTFCCQYRLPTLRLRKVLVTRREPKFADRLLRTMSQPTDYGLRVDAATIDGPGLAHKGCLEAAEIEREIRLLDARTARPS